MTATPPTAVRKPLRAFSLGVFAVSLLMSASVAHAEGYLGKICLTSTVTDRQSGPVTPETSTSEYDATHLGGNSYAIVGFVNIANEPFIATGSGILIGSDLYINVTTTQSHTDSWRDTGVNQTKLNMTTMTGTFYEIGHDYNPATSTWDTRYTAGTVAVTPCP